jgi:hypothetical protein
MNAPTQEEIRLATNPASTLATLGYGTPVHAWAAWRVYKIEQIFVGWFEE